MITGDLKSDDSARKVLVGLMVPIKLQDLKTCDPRGPKNGHAVPWWCFKTRKLPETIAYSGAYLPTAESHIPRSTASSRSGLLSWSIISGIFQETSGSHALLWLQCKVKGPNMWYLVSISNFQGPFYYRTPLRITCDLRAFQSYK